VTWSASELTQASTVALVPLRAGRTPAMRLGSLPELLMGLALLALLATSRGRGPRTSEAAAATR
jgi:apolipoprotein N-acyltransferase